MNTSMINSTYTGLEPVEVWRHFDALNRIARPSAQEAAARNYVKQVAATSGATWQEDEAGNIVVRVAATIPTGAQTPMVAIQSHLDMVCEKRPGVAHNFDTDPIIPRREGERIYATGTTLGADNGLGAALSLALLTTPNLQHGRLELLFTVEEETGLFGAMKLDSRLLQSSMLINLDSEDPDEITVGCAGGAGLVLQLPIERESVDDNAVTRGIVVSGLKGGHSGVQIHGPLGNAIKLLTRVLNNLQSSGVPFRLVSIDGGSAHNAIPRDARATVSVAPQRVDQLESAVILQRGELAHEWIDDEPGLHIELAEARTTKDALTQNSTTELLNLLNELPHGVSEWSQTFTGKVQTSSNLAHVQTHHDSIEISTSSRSFIASELENTQHAIAGIGERAGATAEMRDGYPGWEPKADSRLLQTARAAYENIYGHAPQVQVMHAGLECGAILSKFPDMEAISFGPEIRGAHTPEEYVTISSVPPIWRLLINLLQSLNHNH